MAEGGKETSKMRLIRSSERERGERGERERGERETMRERKGTELSGRAHYFEHFSFFPLFHIIS